MSETSVSREELKWLRRIAGVARKMTARVSFEEVEHYAKEWPASFGPALHQSAARTRDLMTALHMLDLCRRNITPAGRAALAKASHD